MRKRFQKVGRTKMIIIPKTWIDAGERRAGKEMSGVHLDMLDDTITLKPMWEKE